MKEQFEKGATFSRLWSNFRVTSESWAVLHIVSWMLKGWILWFQINHCSVLAYKDSKKDFWLLFLRDDNTICNTTISPRNNCQCFYIAYNTLIEAGPDIVLTRFSSVHVVPSMLGSPLCSHLTIHHYSIHSRARTGA